MSQPQEESGFTCVGCGAAFGTNPRVARALAGSEGDTLKELAFWLKDNAGQVADLAKGIAGLASASWAA